MIASLLVVLLGCERHEAIHLRFPDDFRGGFELVVSDAPDPMTPRGWFARQDYTIDRPTVRVESLAAFEGSHTLTATTFTGRSLPESFQDRPGKPGQVTVRLYGRTAGYEIQFGAVGTDREQDAAYSAWHYRLTGIR